MAGDRIGERRPIVSVGMPVYNGERWLEAASESILNQTLADLELIISDNGSVDATQDLAQRLAASDPRIRYVRSPKNLGVAYNYNRVVRLARAEYFKWASVSDYCDPSMVEKCVRVLEAREDAVLCHPRTWLVGPDGERRAYEHDVELDDSSPCARFKRLVETVRLNNMMNGVIRTVALRRAKPHGAYLAADLPLMAELALGGKCLLIPEPLFFRRVDEFDSEQERLRRYRAERLRYFDPEGRKRMLFGEWKQLFGYLVAARRAPITAGERRCVYRYVSKCAFWWRRKLWTDVVRAVESQVRRAPRSDRRGA